MVAGHLQIGPAMTFRSVWRRLSGFGRGAILASLMGLAAARPSLAQTVPVRGIVFDSARRSALSNVPVALVTAAGSDTVALVASDHVGVFHFEAAPGRYRIVASKPGYRASDGITLTLPAANAGGLLLPLEPLDALAIETRREGDADPRGGPARVLAHIVDAETGRGVEGAEVAIAAPADTARGISDVNGYVALDEVPPLAESLTVRHLAYGDESTPVLLAAGSSYRVELTLRPQALELEGITATSRAEFNRRRRLAPSRIQYHGHDVRPGHLDQAGLTAAAILSASPPGRPHGR